MNKEKDDSLLEIKIIKEKIEQITKSLELYEKRWENYNGNNPNKYKGQINSLKKDLKYYKSLLRVKEEFYAHKIVKN